MVLDEITELSYEGLLYFRFLLFSNLNTRLEFKQIPRNLDTQLKQVFYINSLPGLLFACFKKHFYQIENSSIVFDFFFLISTSNSAAQGEGRNECTEQDTVFQN